MAVEHVNIADGQRHEPKGVSTATVGEIYQADGAESGGWKQPTVALAVKMESISGGTSVYVVAPFAAEVEKIYCVIDGALTGTDETITPKINGTAITGGGITITQSGSAAGDVDSSTPTALKTVAAGDYIEIESAGDSSGSVDAVFTIVLRGN